MEINIKVIDNGFIIRGVLPNMEEEKFEWFKGLEDLNMSKTEREFYVKTVADLSDFLKRILE